MVRYLNGPKALCAVKFSPVLLRMFSFPRGAQKIVETPTRKTHFMWPSGVSRSHPSLVVAPQEKRMGSLTCGCCVAVCGAVCCMVWYVCSVCCGAIKIAVDVLS